MALFKSGFSQQDLAQMEPEDIQRKRKLAEALLAQGADTSPIAHPLQGLARIAQALSGKFQDYRLDKAQSAGKSSADADFASLMGGGSSSGEDGRFTAADLPSAGGSGGYSSASAPSSGPRGSSANVGDPKIFDTFMSTVKEGGLTNPFGLAAVAATGKHESGFSPKNVSGSWSDPSESGRPGTAGGAMSWNNERFAAMRNFVQAGKQADPNADEVRLQAQYFLKEDPQLIERLNAAKSPEEAQTLMNNAWRFAGYNRPGGEAGRRIQTAAQFAQRFAGDGGGQQQAPVHVASLDPAAGMTAPQSAPSPVVAPQQQQPAPQQMTPPAPMPQAPTPPAPPVAPQPPGTPQQDTLNATPVGVGGIPSGSGGRPVVDVTNSPNLSAAAGIPFQQPQGQPNPVAAALMSPQPPQGGGGGVPAGQISPQGMAAHDRMFGGALAPGGGQQNPQALAAALQGGGSGTNYFPPAPGQDGVGAPARNGFPPAPPAPGQGGGAPDPQQQMVAIQRVLNNPHATQAQKAMAMDAYKQIQQRSDPAYQMQLTASQQEIEKNRLAIEAAKNPKKKFDFIKGDDGSIYRTDDSGQMEVVQQGGGDFKVVGKSIYNTKTGEFITEPPSKSDLDYKDITATRKEISGLPSYTNFRQVIPVWQSMTEAAKNDTKAADMNIVYGIAKLMDPGSVVREGEQVIVRDTANLPEQVKGLISSVISGTGRLTAETRRGLLKEAESRVRGYRDAYNKDEEQFRRLASRWGIEPEDILPTTIEIAPTPDLDKIVGPSEEETVTTPKMTPRPGAGNAGPRNIPFKVID